jgi:TIR domain-containing protein
MLIKWSNIQMKKIFISYKWETDSKNKWVENLYSGLRLLGFDAKLDRYEVAPGSSFSHYMTKNIAEADYVIFIITEKSKASVESGEGALAFEMQISNARKLANKGNFSIIPILREGKETPTYLSDHRYLDFREDSKYNESLLYLIKWLNDEIKPPKIGYSTDKPDDIMRVLPILKKLQVNGWALGYPTIGEKGKITFAGNDDRLEYTSKLNTARSKWYKGYYQWDLEWDDEKGVVLVDMLAISEN